MLNPNYFFAYFLLATAVTVLVARRARPLFVKWIAATVTFTAFWAFGHIDDILGEREHRELCAKEAGVRIYKKASLPPEFYNADGTPNFMGPEGPDRKRLEGYIRFGLSKREDYPTKHLRTDKFVHEIVDVINGDVLAQKVDFAAWPSPFVPSIGQAVAEGCPPASARERIELSMDMYRRVFYK
jgi:hypothetical protein